MPTFGNHDQEINRIDKAVQDIVNGTDDLDKAVAKLDSAIIDIGHIMKRAERLAIIALAVAAVGAIPVIRELLQYFHVMN
jgi:hypothetical protein